MSTRFDIYDDLLDSAHSESNAKVLKKLDYPSNYQKSIIKRKTLNLFQMFHITTSVCLLLCNIAKITF